MRCGTRSCVSWRGSSRGSSLRLRGDGGRVGLWLCGEPGKEKQQTRMAGGAGLGGMLCTPVGRELRHSDSWNGSKQDCNPTHRCSSIDPELVVMYGGALRGVN